MWQTPNSKPKPQTLNPSPNPKLWSLNHCLNNCLNHWTGNAFPLLRPLDRLLGVILWHAQGRISQKSLQSVCTVRRTWALSFQNFCQENQVADDRAKQLSGCVYIYMYAHTHTHTHTHTHIYIYIYIHKPLIGGDDLEKVTIPILVSKWRSRWAEYASGRVF